MELLTTGTLVRLLLACFADDATSWVSAESVKVLVETGNVFESGYF